MTDQDQNNFDERDDDTLAAEYVLGVLDLKDRREAERRLQSDQVFASLVRGWENRFADLNDDIDAVKLGKKCGNSGIAPPGRCKRRAALPLGFKLRCRCVPKACAADRSPAPRHGQNESPPPAPHPGHVPAPEGLRSAAA